MATRYLTVSIPYVNARPHVGYALELAQADALARTWRRAGDAVRLVAGTDDNSLKNVLAAEAGGEDVSSFVDRHAQAFRDLHPPLEVAVDDFVRTSADPRHRRAVEALWAQTAARGDLYKGVYEGRYCVGCEEFLTDAELTDGLCPEHLAEPELVREQNWFFRLSRYGGRLLDIVSTGRLRIVPEPFANEVVSFLERGLDDISVSRSAARARGWGIPVPGDPGQVVYVWWDALANYVAALDYGGEEASRYERWWQAADTRAHVVGKGILRFHAVYWPALLLSAGQPLPTDIYVHPYLTADGQKLSKSRGTAAPEPAALADRFGCALRWWLLSDVGRTADTDFTIERLVRRYNDDLAGGFGNLVNRVAGMVHRFRAGRVPAAAPDARGRSLLAAVEEAAARSASLAAGFDFRAATGALLDGVTMVNRFIDEVRPWTLAAQATPDAERATDGALHVLVLAAHVLVGGLEPMLPDSSRELAAQLGCDGGAVPVARPVFPRIEPE